MSRVRIQDKNESPLFQINIWVPCKWDKTYFDTKECELADASEYQESLYSWSMNVDPYLNLSDEEAEQLKNAMFGTFSIEKPVQERSIKKLSELIAFLQGIIEKNNKFISCGTVQKDEETLDIYVQPHLALYRHLNWLLDTFGHTPYANVTFR